MKTLRAKRALRIRRHKRKRIVRHPPVLDAFVEKNLQRDARRVLAELRALEGFTDQIHRPRLRAGLAGLLAELSTAARRLRDRFPNDKAAIEAESLKLPEASA